MSKNWMLRGRNFPGKVLLSRRADSGSNVRGNSSDSKSSDEDGRAFSTERDLKEINGNDATGGSPAGSAGESSGRDAGASEAPRPGSGGRATDSARVARFKKELSATTVNLDALRELAWSGVPADMRPTVWRLLLGYSPSNTERREMVLSMKRQEYVEDIAQFFDIPDADRTEDEIRTVRQISVDIPRTVPDVTFFHQPMIQSALERILNIWAVRHPASGYVQGINDLATPFLLVFLSEHFQGEIESWDVSNFPPEKLTQVEADSYWCLSKLLDRIQDHYTFAQPGIQRLVFKLKELVRRIDEPVAKHLEAQGLDFLQFAFRWFNCLLIREIPFALVSRLWDTYLAEGDAFPDYLVYACASFLLTVPYVDGSPSAARFPGDGSVPAAPTNQEMESPGVGDGAVTRLHVESNVRPFTEPFKFRLAKKSFCTRYLLVEKKLGLNFIETPNVHFHKLQSIKPSHRNT